jgi:hypothetical protein
MDEAAFISRNGWPDRIAANTVQPLRRSDIASLAVDGK